MKSYCIETMLAFGVIAGVCGAALHWNEDHGCMVPAPITGIFMGVSYGAGGCVIGFLWIVMVEIIGAEKRTYQEAKVRAEEANSPSRELLRPSLPDEAAPNILLRPAMSSPNSPPEELLRPGDKPEPHSSEAP